MFIRKLARKSYTIYAAQIDALPERAKSLRYTLSTTIRASAEGGRISINHSTYKSLYISINHSTFEFQDFSEKASEVNIYSTDVFLNADSESPHMT